MNNQSLPKGVVNLVKHVFKDKEVTVTDWDLDRIFISCIDGDYFIRMWNITDHYVDWTLFREEKDSTTQIKDGMFKY
jgi:hypothetical protein